MTTGRRSSHHILDNARAAGDRSDVIDCSSDGTRTYTARLMSDDGKNNTATVMFLGSTVAECGFEEIGSIELSAEAGAEDSGSFPGEVPWNFIRIAVTAKVGGGRADAWMGI